jgi:hypothetical protein
VPELGQVHVEVLEDRDRDSVALADDAQQDVLGSYVVMVEPYRLLAGVGDGLPGSFGESVVDGGSSC